MASSSKTHGDVESKMLFSPVILPENLAAVSPQRNLTGLPRVAKDIAADVYNNIQHWNDYHIKGAHIIKSIVHLKVDNPKTYPDGLETLTEDLYDVVQKLSGVSKALDFLTSQMNSLIKVHKKETPLFFSLSNNSLAELVQSIAEAYQAEYKIKEYVLENISHTKHKSEIMFYAVCWAHQQIITNDIALKLEMLLTETGHRKII